MRVSMKTKIKAEMNVFSDSYDVTQHTSVFWTSWFNKRNINWIIFEVIILNMKIPLFLVSSLHRLYQILYV